MPDEYDAIHFHDDDVSDAGWEKSLALKVPADLKSGVYAARLRADGAEDHLPFYVRPATGKPTAAIAFLAPTLTYQAYANESLDITDYLPLAPLQDMNLQPERFRYSGPLGLKSTYEVHSDGSGVCTSSILHRILDFRPKALCRTFSAPHNFASDLHLVDWLTAKALPHDVITDHDLHRDGAALLNAYNVVVTGAHPEYWTRRIHASTPWNGGSVTDRLGGDMVYLEYPNGGAVFSVGSISWNSTLSYDNYGGDTSRITENVLRAFAKDTLP